MRRGPPPPTLRPTEAVVKVVKVAAGLRGAVVQDRILVVVHKPNHHTVAMPLTSMGGEFMRLRLPDRSTLQGVVDNSRSSNARRRSVIRIWGDRNNSTSREPSRNLGKDQVGKDQD